MKYILYTLCLIIILCINPSVAADNFVLSAGVSVNDIPKTFFGTWRIIAKLDSSDSYGIFKPQSADIWNLSKIGDTVSLTNPFSSATANISIKSIEGNLVVFTKTAPYDNKILTDTVSIRIDKNKFSGINTLKLETKSNVDGSIIKTENARYIIKGEKISGENIIE